MGQIAQMLHDQEVSVIFAVVNDRLDTYRVRSRFDLGVSWFIVYITIIRVLIHIHLQSLSQLINIVSRANVARLEGNATSILNLISNEISVC